MRKEELTLQLGLNLRQWKEEYFRKKKFPFQNIKHALGKDEMTLENVENDKIMRNFVHFPYQLCNTFSAYHV